MAHKMKEIRQIIEAYPQLKFVLTGDSGQDDPMSYREAVEEFPDKISAIFIRDADVPDRKKIVVDVSASLKADKVEMILVENTVEATEHAAPEGVDIYGSYPGNRAEKKEDKGHAPGKEEPAVL